MDVEKAGRKDIGALVGLRLSYLLEDHGPMEEGVLSSIQESLPLYFSSHLNKDLFAYCLREGEEIVSVALLLVVEKPMSPAFLNGRTGTVLNVYTRPSSRRRGYARMVMEALLSEAKRMELSVVELKATEAGYPLYGSLGFKDDLSRYREMKWEDL